MFSFYGYREEVGVLMQNCSHKTRAYFVNANCLKGFIQSFKKIIEKNISLAKTAKTEERFEEMFNFMAEIHQYKHGLLTKDERDLIIYCILRYAKVAKEKKHFDAMFDFMVAQNLENFNWKVDKE